MDLSKQNAFGSENRHTFYSGQNKKFEEYQTKQMNYCKLGGGPAAINLRDMMDLPISTTMGAKSTKFISKSGKFNREPRYVG